MVKFEKYVTVVFILLYHKFLKIKICWKNIAVEKATPSEAGKIISHTCQPKYIFAFLAIIFVSEAKEVK